MATSMMTAPAVSVISLKELKIQLILLGCVRIDGVQMFNIQDEIESYREVRAERYQLDRWGYDAGEDLTVVILRDGSVWLRDGEPDEDMKNILDPDAKGVNVPTSGGWSLCWRMMISRQRMACDELR